MGMRLLVVILLLCTTSTLIFGQGSEPAVAKIPDGKQATDFIPTGPLPKRQKHCLSEIYCPGPLLQAVQLAALYEDSKTFVDKPTIKPESEVLSAFSKLGNGKGGNVTYQEILDFVNNNFGPEGNELVDVQLDDFKENPTFIKGIEDVVIKDFLKQVHGYWKSLARTTNATTACQGCSSSFLPFKEPRTFVIPGGRFRELYYWDTYFVIQGLLRSELGSIAKDMLMNFADLVEEYGFVPNGNRIYYLNRSQPPLLNQMVSEYIQETNDTSILFRMLPVLVKEFEFWDVNRTMEIASPFTHQKHNLTLYDVDTNAPRPESYLEDYETVELAKEEQNLTLTDKEKDRLYADLASGAESGQDYSAIRWSKQPLINTTDTIPAQRFLNTAQQVPMDLNAILYKNEMTLSRFFKMNVKSEKESLKADMSTAKKWAQRAAKRKEAILDLCWDKERSWYYDFNMTSNARSPYWTASGFFPFWANIMPPFVTSQQASVGEKKREMQTTFSSLRYLIDRYNGSISNTLLETGQQWDAPNAWPPHTFIAIEALRFLPESLANGRPLPAPNGSYALIPKGTVAGKKVNQLGSMEVDLPKQLLAGSNETIQEDKIGATSSTDGSQEVQQLSNVGNSTLTEGKESWREELIRELSNRYMASALCTWRSTGGVLNLTKQQDPNGDFATVSPDVLQREGAANATGIMFEKYSNININAAGGGGEYEVVEGFGWNNGCAIWIGAEYGKELTRPQCPPITV